MNSNQNIFQPSLPYPDEDPFLKQIKEGNERYADLMRNKRLEILNRIAKRFFYPSLYRSIAIIEMESEKYELARYSAELTQFDYLIYRSCQTIDWYSNLRPAQPTSFNKISMPPIICQKKDPLFALLENMNELDESIMDMHRQELRAMSEEQDRHIMEYIDNTVMMDTEDKPNEHGTIDVEFSVTPYPVSDAVKNIANRMMKNYINTGTYFDLKPDEIPVRVNGTCIGTFKTDTIQSSEDEKPVDDLGSEDYE